MDIKKVFEPGAMLLRRFLLELRFLIAGGTAFAVNFVTLFILKNYFGIWYLSAAVASFTVAFVASFLLQKFWVFKNDSVENQEKQLGIFLLTALFNLGINTLLMYCFVDYLAFHYLFAQVMASAIIAVYSFILYKYVVFKVVKTNG